MSSVTTTAAATFKEVIDSKLLAPNWAFNWLSFSLGPEEEGTVQCEATEF